MRRLMVGEKKEYMPKKDRTSKEQLIQEIVQTTNMQREPDKGVSKQGEIIGCGRPSHQFDKNRTTLFIANRMEALETWGTTRGKFSRVWR